MQASAQDLSAIMGNLIQGSATATALPGQSQPAVSAGENAESEFQTSLETSLDELAQGQQQPAVPLDSTQLQSTFEESLEGQQQAQGGNGLPLATEVAAAGDTELTPGLQSLMNQLQQAASAPGELENSDLSLPFPQPAQAVGQSTSSTAASHPLFDHMNMVILPASANEVAQAQVEQHRLFERFQSLPELQLSANGLPASVLRQALRQQGGQSSPQSSALSSDAQNSVSWLGGANADLALTPVAQGDDFELQMSRMAELKNVALPSKEGAALESMVKSDMLDVTSLNSAAPQRHTTPAALSDARPMQSFVHVPLHDPRWQSEFSNRVTWLARSGGNQTAEIHLNPANMGPIRVQVVMNDDQATITFTAQHGVARDAIEASLPRLREMFMGSGLQLAQANVSDHPLHDQRQQQGFGSGNGRPQGSYEQVESIADLVTPVSLSMPNSTAPASRLDLYA